VAEARIFETVTSINALNSNDEGEPEALLQTEQLPATVLISNEDLESHSQVPKSSAVSLASSPRGSSEKTQDNEEISTPDRPSPSPNSSKFDTLTSESSPATSKTYLGKELGSGLQNSNKATNPGLPQQILQPQEFDTGNVLPVRDPPRTSQIQEAVKSDALKQDPLVDFSPLILERQYRDSNKAQSSQDSASNQSAAMSTELSEPERLRTLIHETFKDRTQYSKSPSNAVFIREQVNFEPSCLPSTVKPANGIVYEGSLIHELRSNEPPPSGLGHYQTRDRPLDGQDPRGPDRNKLKLARNEYDNRRLEPPPPTKRSNKDPTRPIGWKAPIALDQLQESALEDCLPAVPPGDAKRLEILPGAPWTKISRLIVNPEALELGNEVFESSEDFVVVHRILSREEIKTFATVTSEIRGRS
jgi:hypothetical protein